MDNYGISDSNSICSTIKPSALHAKRLWLLHIISRKGEFKDTRQKYKLASADGSNVTQENTTWSD